MRTLQQDAASLRQSCGREQFALMKAFSIATPLPTINLKIGSDKPLFATSLTKSASSRVFDSFFVPFAHTPALRSPAVSFGPAMRRNFSDCSSCPTYETRFVSLHRLGVAHQTSLRSCPTMMMYSNSPQLGRRVAYSLDPVTAPQDHCCDQASPHGHYRFPAAPFRDGRTLGNRSGHAS